MGKPSQVYNSKHPVIPIEGIRFVILLTFKPSVMVCNQLVTRDAA